MALEDTKIPYELLIRFGLDGAPAGAHVQYRRRVVLDGEVLKDEPQPAEPIDLDGFPTSKIMSNATRDALAKVVDQQVQLDALTEQLSGVQGQLAALQEKLAQADAAIAKYEAGTEALPEA